MQHERYYLVRCDSLEYTNANQHAVEKRTYTVARWWSVPAMRRTVEVIYPERLADRLAPVIAEEPVIAPVALPE